jgi:sarcosine oxidase subunit beta
MAMGGEPARRTAQPGTAPDVAVVGAGVIGLSIAYHAAAQGLSTVVYERSGIAAEASGVQPGGVRQQWSTEVNCLLARESYAFYREINDHLQTRVRPVLESCGYLFLAHSSAALDQLKRNVELQNRHGIPSRLVASEEIPELVQGLRIDDVSGASFCLEDGYFDKPQAVVEAFAQAAVRLGARIELSEVSAIRANGGGWELELGRGGRVHSDQVVVAASYDTNELLATLGVELPLTKAPKYLFLSDPIRERLLEPLVISQELHFAAKQLADGRVLASDLSAHGDPAVAMKLWRDHIRSVVDKLLPILHYVSYPVLVEGFYDMTPDSQGIVSSVDGFHGLWVAAGFSGHGFMVAPAVGRAMSTLLQGSDPGPPFEHLHLERFDHAELERETQVV